MWAEAAVESLESNVDESFFLLTERSQASYFSNLYSREEKKLRVHWNSRSICWLRRNVSGRKRRELRKVENSLTYYESEEE